MSRWFRHYAGLARDDKMVRVALKAKQPVERVIWVWVAILESASEINDNGKYDFDVGEAAYFLRTDECDIQSIMSALQDLGRISEGNIARWSERQFQSDTSAERQRRYRDNRKIQNRGDDNRTVTSPSRHGDAPELDTDTDTEKKENTPRAARVSVLRFEEFYREYPKRVERSAAEKKYIALVKSGVAEQTLIDGAKAYAAFCRSKNTEPQYIKSPVVWLNRGCWTDELSPSASNVLPIRVPMTKEESWALAAKIDAEMAAEKAAKERRI